MSCTKRNIESDRKIIYKKMIKIEENLKDLNSKYLNFNFSVFLSLYDNEYIEDILRFIIMKKDKEILLFTPFLKILIMNLIEEYDLLEKTNYHTLNRFLVLYNETIFL
jgi:hypothetical protein